MVTANDPLVRISRAGNARNYVVNRLHIPVEADFEMHLGWPRSDEIGDRQSSAPTFRRHLTRDSGQQRLRVRIGDGQRRDFREGRHLAEFQAFGILGRSYPWRQRVAGINRHIHYAATLHAVAGPKWARGVNASLKVSILFRIRIDDAANCAMLGRHLGLDAAPGGPITRDHDGALHGDT